MFSLIAAISSSAYNYVFGPKKPDDDQEDEIAILENALQARREQESVTVPEDDNEAGCFMAEGRITTIAEEYVIINNKLYCSILNAPPNLSLGTKVRYLAYQSHEDKEIKVSKVENIIDDWQDEEPDTSEPSNSAQNLTRVNKQKMMTKALNEVVTRREGRLVFAGDLTIDLNTVASDFVPLVGDSVKVTALVAVDPESPDYAGQVVTVRRIEPNLSKYIIGTISNFDPDQKTGIVDMRIFFHRSAIGIGYVPCVGDTVACDCIESRSQSYRWRALLIYPLHKVKKSEVANITKHGLKLPPNINELEKNKNGVEVDNGLEVKLEMMREKELKIAVSNKGCVMRVIKKCSLTADKNQSQLRLLRPRETDQVKLMGGEVITYVFKVKGMFVGKSTELIQFHFETFQIARLVTVVVRPMEVIRTRTSAGCTFNRNVQIRERDYDKDSRVRGTKPFPVAHFAVSNGIFKVNKELESLVIRIANSKMSARESENQLIQAFPEFANTLNFATYRKNFHNLLFLEEIAVRINIQMFALESVIFNSVGEFFTIQVPGLAEKRPSLIVGDKVVAEYKFAKSHDKKKFEGYIHKIRNTEIYIKFNLTFHESYNREDCRVNFEASTIVLQRSHRAINAVYNNLGINFLFPARVTEKEPQYVLREIDPENQPEESSDKSIKTDIDRKARMSQLMEMIEDLNDEDKVKVCQETFKTKKLQWYNEKLNEYQKEAVKNILTGVARPLPYIIFGPPGTGKTITIVETVLQIFTLITDSRILIATPSNSSANLIAEKLLDYNVLKPGDLVRLVANYYMISDAIPDRLRPYCATADLTSANSSGLEFETTHRADSETRCLNVIQLGRHRIIIGTCAALGIMHNMGFKEGQFSHVLIDEAGQATEPECMIPLSFLDLETGQAILAGDPLQLGPVVISKLGDHFGYSQSFLFRLLQLFPYQRDTVGFKNGYDPRLVTKLLINYRSLPEMLQLPNDMFYDSELIPFIQYKGSKEALLLERMRDDLPKRKGPAPAIVFHGVNGVNRQDDDSPSWYNCEEATQVYLYFLRLCEKKFTADDIGIITPYKKQVAEIRSLISGVDVEEIPKVGTVEEFQGQERNVIIVSTVRSMSDLVANDVKFTLGFVSAPQRLNVAITRARSLLIIIGNPGLLSQDPYWKSVLDFCTKRECYTGCNWSPIIQNLSTPT